MPFVHNGKTFQVWSIDTNVLSEMLKSPTEAMRRVLLMSLEDNAALGFSVWVLLELRRRRDLYDKFVSLFSVLPLAILKSQVELLDDEISAYPDPSAIKPSLFGFNPFANAPKNDLAALMETFFDHNAKYREAEKEWNGDLQEDTLNQMLSLRSNFPPNGHNYTSKQLDTFVYCNVVQQVFFRNQSWLRKFSGAGAKFDASAFPSIRMCAYTVFYRFYDGQRKPQKQDVMDILISSVTPYVDCVLTEQHHADTIAKIMKRDSMLDGLRVETLRSIRGW